MDDKHFALVPALRIEPLQESVCCVETGSGELYFEFWLQGRPVSSRMHADTLIQTLLQLRMKPRPDELFSRPKAQLARAEDTTSEPGDAG